MKTKILGVGVLLLALAGGLIWSLSNSSKSKSTKPAVTSSQKPKVAMTMPGPPPARASVPMQRELDPEGSLRLEGQVIDENEQGVAGANVAISSMPPRFAQTEDDGSFVFEGLSQRDYALEAHSAGLYAAPISIRLRDGSEPAILRMKAGRSLHFEIRSADGDQPIPNAAIEVRSGMDWYAGLSWSATSDAAGKAELIGLPTSEIIVHVQASGYARYSGRLAGGEAEQQRILLQGGVAVYGLVVDTQGAPVADARVAALSASEPFPVVDPRLDGALTDKAGAFKLPDLAAGSYRFVISHPTLVAENMSPVLVTPASSPIRLVATGGASLTGKVVDGSGAPVAGAEVAYIVQGSIPWRTRRRASTSATGEFRFAALPAGGAELVASTAAASSELTEVSLQAGETKDITLSLSIEGTISGLVVDGSGEPVPEAQLLIEPVFTGALGEVDRWQARDSGMRVADGGGAFNLAGLPEGRYAIRAAAPGAQERALYLATATEARTGASEVRVTAEGESKVRGRLVYQDGGAVPLFTIDLGAGAPLAIANPEGRFVIQMPAGEHGLRFAGPSFAPTQAVAKASAGQDLDLGSISVERGRSIIGLVIDEGGKPVPEAEVAAGALLTGDGSKLFIEDESIMARTTKTDAQGRFAFDGFGEHPITVVAGLDGVGRARALQIPAGPLGAEVTLSLEPTSSLKGVIKMDGTPISETVVIATPIGTTATNFVVTGTDGSYAYDSLTPGEYMVYPMIGGGGNRPKDMHIKTVVIRSGESAQRDIEAHSGTAQLSVEVVDADGKPASAHVLAFASQYAPDAPRVIDSFLDGSWLRGLNLADEAVSVYFRQATGEATLIEKLVPGRYTACAAQRGMQRGPPSGSVACASVEVSENSPASLRLSLPKPDAANGPQ